MPGQGQPCGGPQGGVSPYCCFVRFCLMIEKLCPSVIAVAPPCSHLGMPRPEPPQVPRPTFPLLLSHVFPFARSTEAGGEPAVGSRGSAAGSWLGVGEGR